MYNHSDYTIAAAGDLTFFSRSIRSIRPVLGSVHSIGTLLGVHLHPVCSQAYALHPNLESHHFNRIGLQLFTGQFLIGRSHCFVTSLPSYIGDHRSAMGSPYSE